MFLIPIIIFLSLLQFPQMIEAKEKELYAKDSLPIEFQLLIESLYQVGLPDSDLEKVKSTITTLDQNFSKISKKYLYFLIKTEIYRELMDSKKDEQPELKIDNLSAQKLNHKLNKNFQQYHSFAKWIIEAIQSDLWNDHEESSQQMKKYISPWFEAIIIQNPNDFNQGLVPIMLRMLENIHLLSKIYLQYGVIDGEHAGNQTLAGKERKLIYFQTENNIPKIASPHKREEFNLPHYQQLKKIQAEKLIQDISKEEDLPSQVPTQAISIPQATPESPQSAPIEKPKEDQDTAVKKNELQWIPQ